MLAKENTIKNIKIGKAITLELLLDHSVWYSKRQKGYKNIFTVTTAYLFAISKQLLYFNVIEKLFTCILCPLVQLTLIF